jgi:hypothetical protein
MNRRSSLALSALVVSTVILTACGSNGDSKQDPSTATPIPNVQIPYEPTATPTVGPEPTLVPGKQTVAPVPAESPRVVWARSSHAGPGAVTIRFESNVPVVGEVRVMTNQVGPEFFFSAFSTPFDTPATEHTVSVPANAFGRYTIRLQDAHSNIAWATLRYKSDANGIDWATGENAPELTAVTSKKLVIDWAFPQGHPSKLGFEGSVHIFSIAATCTTADSCIGDPVGQPIEAAAGGNANLETHAVESDIPGAAFDYQVVIGQPLNANSSTMIFLQLDIRGDQLPKTQLPAGPGDIKN